MSQNLRIQINYKEDISEDTTGGPNSNKRREGTH